MIHVLMTTDTVSDVWPYALQLADSLRGDVRFTLATMGPAPSAVQRRQAAQRPNVRVEHLDRRLEWMSDPWDDVAAAGRWLVGLAAEHQPDVIHLNHYCFGSLSLHAPTLLMGHGDLLSRLARSDDGGADPVPTATPDCRQYATFVRSAVRMVDLVAAPTRRALDELQQRYGPLRRTRVLPHARSGDVFKPLEKRRQIHLAAGSPVADDVVVRKAAAEIGWTVTTPDAEDANRAAHLGTAGVFCETASYDPFGLAVLEAGLCGCALVVADVPGLRETWADAAALVEPGDAEDLAHTLHRLLRSHTRRAALADAARRRASRYTPKAQAAAYLSTYETLLGHTSPRDPAPRRLELRRHAVDDFIAARIPSTGQTAAASGVSV